MTVPTGSAGAGGVMDGVGDGLPADRLVAGGRADGVVAGGVVEPAPGLELLVRLAAGVAHDVNNVLAVVALRADLALDGVARGAPDEETVEDLQAIVAATTRAAELTGKLMLFAGQRTADRRRVDLAAAVEALGPRLDALAGSPWAVARSTGAVPYVEAPDGHLETVVLALVANALAATAPAAGGEPRVWVRVGTAAAPRPTGSGASTDPEPGPARPVDVVLEVSDAGTGMTPDVRAHAVEPYFRAGTAGGSGLGLAVVQGIVGQLGGTLAIAGTPGRGTVVRVTVPALDGAEPARPDGAGG